jgi:DNA replication and repair protein RecF
VSLRIEHIAFSDFRNYEALDLDGISDLTVFVGPNAVGKTNIVEGIQLLTAQSSFKHPTTLQMIRQGATSARLAADVSDGNRELSIALSLSEGKRSFSLNGKTKRTADLKGLAPSVSFTPDDLQLSKGSMSLRRDAIDAMGSQMSRNHYLIRKDWDKVLRQKNMLLKDEADAVMLESVNDLVITCGAQLTCYRAALFAKLSAYMESYYSEIAGSSERMDARFAPSWAREGEWLSRDEALTKDDARSLLAEALKERLSEERIRRRSLVGPQADRIEFFVGGKQVSVYGSQGQQRSVVLAFKLAEVSLIRDILSQQPILLLDDVMSELDEHRRRSLIRFVSSDIQTFITTANLAYFDKDLLAHADIVQLPLEGGKRNG